MSTSARPVSPRLALRTHGALAPLIFAVAALLVIWPALLQGKFISPGTTNLVLSDVIDVLQPWADYAREMIRSGELPAWNPYTLSGTPFLTNPQATIFSPFSLLIWVLPFKYGLALSAALKLWVAAIGTYALVRRLGVGWWAGVGAGLAYGLLPFNILWLQFPHTAVWAFLPLMLWATERVIADGRTRDAAWLALAAAGAFFSGHPESAAHVAGATALYAVIRVLQFDAGWADRARRLGLAALGGVAGALLAAPALLPIALNLHDAAWAEGRAHYGEFHLPFASLRTLLFPDWWGRPTGLQIPGAAYNFNENTMYPGAAALALAAVGVATSPWRRTLPWLILFAVGLSAALGFPPVYTILKHVPPYEMATNTRLIGMLGLATVVMAAFGIDALVEGARPSRRVVIVAAAVVAVGVVVFIGLTPSLHELKLLQNHFRTRTAWPEAITLTAVAWFIGLTALVLIAVLVRPRVGAAVVGGILLFAIALDVGHFARNYNPFQPDPGGPAPRPALGSDRVLVDGAQPDRQMPLRLRDARGYDPPMPRLRYIRLWQRAIPSQGLAVPVVIGPPADDAQRRLLQLLSVRTIAAPTGAVVARDNAAAPRAYVPTAVKGVGSEKAALDAMFAPAFVPGRDAVVEGTAPAAAKGAVTIAREENSRVDLRAELDRGGLVVLNDVLDDGWSVKVDGQDADVERVNSVMRGVQVPAGAHDVSWTYRVPGLRAGLVLCLLGIALTAFLALRRRPQA